LLIEASEEQQQMLYTIENQTLLQSKVQAEHVREWIEQILVQTNQFF
jgi:hypothetical protein